MLSRHLPLSLSYGITIALSTPHCSRALLADQSVRRISRPQKKKKKNENWAARLISLAPKHSYVTPVLKELHCFPVRHHMAFKLFKHTCKTLNGTSSSHLY